MSHLHFCETTGHKWECEGTALRFLAGDMEPSVCICGTCQVPTELGDHSHCEIELVACPQHVDKEQQLVQETEEFLKTPAGLYMAELFARRDALADDDPEKHAVAAEILRHTFECMNNTPAVEQVMDAGLLDCEVPEEGQVSEDEE